MKKNSDQGAIPPSTSLLFDPRYVLALGFGSGLSRWAPGTCGTIAAVPFYWYFLAPMQSSEYIFMVVIAALLGIYVCGSLSRKLKVPDHSSIVWDEFVGLWITLWGIPNKIEWLIVGIIIFRFLDIMKPWPIRLIDSNVKGGIGIMLDDIVAGLIGCAMLNFFSKF